MAAPRTAPVRYGEIRVKKETTAGEAIGTASTYWAASPQQIKAWDVSLGLKKVSEDDPSLALNAYEDRPRILLGKRGTLGFKSFLSGLAATEADTVAVTQDPLGLLLQAAMGGEQLDTTTTVDGTNTGTGTAAAPLKVVSGAGLTIGGAIRVAGELRRIVNKSGNNLTLDMALTAAPTSGNVAAAATYFLKEDALVNLSDADHITLAALFRGYDAEDQWQLRGGFPAMELGNLGENKTPHCQWTLHSQAWELVTGVAAPSAFTEGPNPVQVNAGCYVNTVGTETRNYIHVAGIDIKLGLKVDELTSPAAENGVVGHAVFGGRSSVEVEFYYDSEWNVAYEAGTQKYLGYQIGTAVLISCPALYLDETPERGGSAAATAKAKFHANNAGAAPSSATELGRSRISIHRFPKTA